MVPNEIERPFVHGERKGAEVASEEPGPDTGLPPGQPMTQSPGPNPTHAGSELRGGHSPRQGAPRGTNGSSLGREGGGVPVPEGLHPASS